MVGGLSSSAGTDAAEQQKRCGLALDRVRWPVGEKAWIGK
jgi:hypothetical protein